MPATRRFLALLLLLVPTLIADTAIAATSHTEAQRPRTAAQALLGTSDGYVVGVYFPTPKLAELYVFAPTGAGDQRGFAQAVYAVRTRSRLVDGELRADFGPIGRVALRFRPNGKTRRGRIQEGCRGPRPLRESGRVRGTVRLEGEDGYFRLSTAAGPAERERSFRLLCERGRALNVPPNVQLRELVSPGFGVTWSSGGGTNAVLNVAAKTAGRFVALRASHQEGSPAGAEIQLATLEFGHGMAIGRGLVLEAGEGTLRTSLPGAHPATATFAPPKPFYGEANYVGTSATSHAWTGSLGVRLPGLDLPLTGPRFLTSLCVLSSLKTPNGCDFTKPKPLLPARLGPVPQWGPR